MRKKMRNFDCLMHKNFHAFCVQRISPQKQRQRTLLKDETLEGTPRSTADGPLVVRTFY